MNIDDSLLSELLTSWEETYKKGQLTFWMFLSLKDGAKYADEIVDFISKNSFGTMYCEDQSLYRMLRKFEHLEIITYETRKGNKGPDRKYYSLTPLGVELLKQFTNRNIKLLQNPTITKLFD